MLWVIWYFSEYMCATVQVDVCAYAYMCILACIHATMIVCFCMAALEREHSNFFFCFLLKIKKPQYICVSDDKKKRHRKFNRSMVKGQSILILKSATKWRLLLLECIQAYHSLVKHIVKAWRVDRFNAKDRIPSKFVHLNS